MFIEIDQSLVRQRNEELMHEARKWHLQRSLRANRENRRGTRPHVDSKTTDPEVIGMKQIGGSLMTLKLRKERPAWSMKALALGLLGRRKTS